MLHAAETWAMKVDTLNRLRRNNRATIRWICNVRAKDEVSSDSLWILLTLKIVLSGEDAFEKACQKAQPLVEENRALKWI